MAPHGPSRLLIPRCAKVWKCPLIEEKKKLLKPEKTAKGKAAQRPHRTSSISWTL